MQARYAALIALLLAICVGNIHAATRQSFTLHTPPGDIVIECVARCADVVHPSVLILSGSKGFGSSAYDQMGRTFQGAGLGAYLVHYLAPSDVKAIANAGSSPARVRYYKQHQAQWIVQIQAVLAYFNTRHHELGKVGVLGISLGAEMAAAVSANRTDIGALVLVDGGFPDDYSQPTRSLPPLHLIWGGADRTFPLSVGLDLQKLARQRGGTASLSIYKGCPHDFFVRPDLPQAQDAHLDAARFLVSQLSGGNK
jgi:dienelactone hydrolase